MTSDVQICNMALMEIGHQKLIQSLEEQSVPANYCKTLYIPTRDALLESYHWGFAKKTQTLALLDETPAPGWTYAYSYPSNCLLPRRIQTANIWDDPIPFEMQYDGEKRVIYCNTASPVLEYTVKLTDPGLFSPLFIKALALELASLMVVPLAAGSKVDKQTLERKALGARNEAKGADQSNRQEDTNSDANWIRGRL